MSKLHPVYVALDGHQYNRAIKLCLALPKTNILGQALLAHAYAKSGQRYKSLLTLQSILGNDGYQELKLEIQCSIESRQQAAASESSSNQQPKAPSTTSKKGKKGKKKAPVAAPKSAPTTASAAADFSRQSALLIEVLDSPPTIDDQWETLPPTNKDVITDETTLGTLAVTLQNLKLPLTVYQLYCCAASKGVSREEDFILQKAFLAGLAVISSPQYGNITTKILANMQVLAVQLARVQDGSKRATSWAAQTALWQIKMLSSTPFINEEERKKHEQRMNLLPRLAETFASKSIQMQFDVHAEDYFLYVRALEAQSKWQEMLSVLENDFSKEGLMLASAQQVLEQKTEVLRKLEQFQKARITYEELLKDYPDNWTYLKGHLDCSIFEHNGEIDTGISRTEELVSQLLKQGTESSSHYPLRGPHLMKVELAAYRIRQLLENDDIPNDLTSKLSQSIIEYGDEFAARVSCAFSDLCQYLDLVLKLKNMDQVETLLEWLKKTRTIPNSEDVKEKSKQLRAYIFGIKMTLKILSENKDLYDHWKPDWKELVQVWNGTKQGDEKKNDEQPNMQGDELIILAVQQLLWDGPGRTELFTAATLLEMGMKSSPTNPNLKITAMRVYSEQCGVSRCWELFKELQIKHIQLDSCSFVVLPMLVSGGFYREAIEVCQEILRLHTSVVRDTGEFSGRAMENGTLTKAEEFLVFQRDRLNRSITALEAKGIILDCASLSFQDAKNVNWVGGAHGVVGGENDYERAMQMVVEVRNPYGALDLLNVTKNAQIPVSEFSDNRDATILSHEILVRREMSSADQILNSSIRRAHYHQLLIRAALCKKGTKFPKKGKVVKASDEMKQCCRSLLSSVDSATDFFTKQVQANGYAELTDAIFELCRVLSVVGAGMFQQDTEDTLDNREKYAADHLKKASSCIEEANAKLALLEDISLRSVARVCRLLPDCVVSLFALFRMCEDLMESFGWGKRKQKSKPSAEALAQLAAGFAEIVTSMKFCLMSLDNDKSSSSELDDLMGASDLVDEGILRQMHDTLSSAQKQCKNRVDPILTEVKSHLDTFSDTSQ